MRRIRWVPVVVVTAALLALAACSNGSDGDGVASLGGGQAAGGASPSPSVSDEEAAQAFAECMRENGIEDFPDPQVDEDGGGIVFEAGSAEGGPPQPEDRERLDAAMQACEDLLPEGSGPDSISSEEQAALQDAFLEYAQCMRDHGIDMPDPDFSDGGVNIGGGGDVDPNSEAFQEADEACKHFLGDIGAETEEAPGG